jgi:hypothetical protein
MDQNHRDNFRIPRDPGTIAKAERAISISGLPTLRVLSSDSEGYVVNWFEAARERFGGSGEYLLIDEIVGHLKVINSREEVSPASRDRIQGVTAITSHGDITGEADE